MQCAQRLSLEKESFTEDFTMSLLCPAGNCNKLLDLKTVFLPLMWFIGIRILCYHKALFEEKIDADELLSGL